MLGLEEPVRVMVCAAVFSSTAHSNSNSYNSIYSSNSNKHSNDIIMKEGMKISLIRAEL